MRGKDNSVPDVVSRGRWGYGPGSFSADARARRFTRFMEVFPELSQLHVVDLGGRPSYWLDRPVRPLTVTCVNLEPLHSELSWIRCLQQDALSPLEMEADLVVSNSLIEHVGGQAMRERMADAVRAIAPRYWIQTPYRYFPLEPHWMFPGMQFFPLALRERLAERHWAQGTRFPQDYARRSVAWTELLSMTDMRRLFPEAVVWRERVLGLTKSIVAINW